MGIPSSSYLAEGIIVIASAGLFVAASIRYQYVYQIVSEAHNFTSNKSLDYCLNDSNSSVHDEDIVQDEASRWLQYMLLASSLPAVFSAPILTSWSDKVGRKVALFFPVFGYAVANIIQLFTIMYSLPPYTLVIGSAVVGVTGSFTAMLNLGMAYLSDITTKQERLKRFTIIECGMGLGGGLINFACGFWITSSGFLPSSWLTAACGCISVVLIPLLPCPKRIAAERQQDNVSCNNSDVDFSQDCKFSPDSKKLDDKTVAVSSFVSRLKMIWRVYTSKRDSCYLCNIELENCEDQPCIHGNIGRKGRVWRILLYLAIFNLFLYPILGMGVVRTMYFVSYPLCFSPTLIGILTGIVFGSLALGPPIIIFCKSILKWQNGSLLVITMLASIVMNTTMGFATDPTTILTVSLLNAVSKISIPILRVQISSLAMASEQGAALGLISGTETFTNMLANITYLIIYPASLSVFRGFIFLYSAAIITIAWFLVIFIWIADKRRDRKLENEEYSPLIVS